MNLYHVTKFSRYFLFTVYCFYTKISSFTSALSIRIALDCFYLLIFYSEKFSTDVCRLLYAVNVNLNLSNELVAWLISRVTNSSDRLQSVTSNWDKPLLQSSLASVIKQNVHFWNVSAQKDESNGWQNSLIALNFWNKNVNFLGQLLKHSVASV